MPRSMKSASAERSLTPAGLSVTKLISTGRAAVMATALTQAELTVAQAEMSDPRSALRRTRHPRPRAKPPVVWWLSTTSLIAKQKSTFCCW